MNIYDPIKTVVGPSGWTSDPDELQPLLHDWRGAVVGKSSFAVFPKSTQEVADVLRACSASRISVVPQGGNTGMCAGAIPDGSGEQIILSLRRMNKVRELDTHNYSMEVEAGCVLQDVRSQADAQDRHFAISIGAQGSCQIGGNLSTNAGGLNVLRYGPAREQVLGLEVVLADGTVLNGLRALRKDTAGYDLKQLFIGSEGTLGIITAAALKLHSKPGPTCTALVALSSGEQAIELLTSLRSNLGGVFEAFELISGSVFRLVTEQFVTLRSGFDDDHACYVLLEAEAESERLTEALAGAAAKSLLVDAIIAKSDHEAAELWRMRHSISEAERRYGKALKHDISVPVSKLASFLTQGDALLAKLAPQNTLLAFGHMGDGNLHYNIALDAPLDDPQRVSTAIYDLVDEMGGSFSAEHGVGSVKRAFLHRYRSPSEITLMATLKQALDPLNILNPGKVI